MLHYSTRGYLIQLPPFLVLTVSRQSQQVSFSCINILTEKDRALHYVEEGGTAGPGLLVWQTKWPAQPPPLCDGRLGTSPGVILVFSQGPNRELTRSTRPRCSRGGTCSCGSAAAANSRSSAVHWPQRASSAPRGQACQERKKKNGDRPLPPLGVAPSSAPARPFSPGVILRRPPTCANPRALSTQGWGRALVRHSCRLRTSIDFIQVVRAGDQREREKKCFIFSPPLAVRRSSQSKARAVQPTDPQQHLISLPDHLPRGLRWRRLDRRPSLGADFFSPSLDHRALIALSFCAPPPPLNCVTTSYRTEHVGCASALVCMYALALHHMCCAGGVPSLSYRPVA